MKKVQKVKFYLTTVCIIILMLGSGCKKEIEVPPTVSDVDGNMYTTIVIGKQAWLVENLKTTRYRNGDIIPNVVDSVEWKNIRTGAQCYYNNDQSNSYIYGSLYNWYVVNDPRKICPEGWHVPSDAEWAALTTSLGGLAVSGGKMKQEGITLWNTPNTGATNQSGFTALPSGRRRATEFMTHADYEFLGNAGRWWSSSQHDTETAWTRAMHFDDMAVERSTRAKVYGLAIRCIKD